MRYNRRMRIAGDDTPEVPNSDQPVEIEFNHTVQLPVGFQALAIGHMPAVITGGPHGGGGHGGGGHHGGGGGVWPGGFLYGGYTGPEFDLIPVPIPVPAMQCVPGTILPDGSVCDVNGRWVKPAASAPRTSGIPLGYEVQIDEPMLYGGFGR